MTDFRALCAELVEDLALWLEYDGPPSRLPKEEDESCRLLRRARTALAEPKPEGPTDEELLELMPQVMRDDLASVSRLSGAQIGLAAGVFRTTLNVRVLEYARAVLARWGS